MISRSRFDNELRHLGLIDEEADSTSALSLSLRDPGGDLTAGFEPSAPVAEQLLIEPVFRALRR